MLGRLLQLSSANLPVGAFAYSEGLETLVVQGVVQTAKDLQQWLVDALEYGSIRVDTAVLRRQMAAVAANDRDRFQYWDAWLGASRESEEMRAQSHHMGRALQRLYREMSDDETPLFAGSASHFVSGYAQVAVAWHLPVTATLYAYVHSWAANLITAGVRLIPLGQSDGQRILWLLQERIEAVLSYAETAADEALCAWNFGQALASMSHETLYSRLYRS
ncbi:urease accessory protein UreF [Acidithiobacillus sp. M4-SHS-6]|uniref:urease accessory protein UreF n=1 Tax=Acidithiobacillus sp. M4-SHS-6 TaxID=3383024 RepID=UPI0039BE2752